MGTLLRLTAANLRSLVRDRAAIFWTFFFPVMFVFLFGSIFSNQGKGTIDVGVVDNDHSAVSTVLVDQLQHSQQVLTVHTGSQADEESAMKNGNVSAVIVIPQGFGTSGSPSLTVDVDPSQQQVSQIVVQVAQQMAQGVVNGGQNIVTVNPQNLTTEQLPMVNYLVPSILAMSLMQLGVFACVPLVEQREKGILKRLGATPLPRWTLVGSNILMRLIVAAIQTVLILGIGAAVFNVHLFGNPLAVAGLVFLGSATFLSLGYLVASFLRTEEQANGVTQVIQMPMMFLSGIFFPFSMLPDFLGQIGRIMPLTYLGDAMRQVMVNGTALAPLPVDLAILGGWLVVCLGVTVRFFRWE